MAKVIDIEMRPTGNGIRSLLDQFKALKKAKEEATAVDDIDKVNKALRVTEDEVEGINKAIQGFDLSKRFDDVYEGIAPLSSRLGELEDRMYELAFAGKANTEEFKALQTEAIRMRQTIIQVDKQVDILADNQGLSAFGDGINEAGASLLRLDFDTASKQAQTLAANAGKISFGQAIKSLKSLGSTFASLGKALLTNPLFIIVTVVGLIVVGIVKLMDKLGVLTAIFEAVGDAIDWVIQLLKDFVDWLGIGNFAAQDAHEQTIKRNNELIESENKKNEAIIDGIQHQIQISELRGEDTFKLEKERLRVQFESAKEQVRLNYEILASVEALHGAESDEFKEALKNAEESKKLFRESIQEVEIFKEERKKKQREDAEDARKEAEDNAKERAQKAKEYAQNRLNAERQIEDLRIESMQDDAQREIETNRVKYERLIEDTKRSTILLEGEKAKLVEYYQNLSIASEQKLRDKRLADEQKLADDLAKIRRAAKDAWLDEEEALQEEIDSLTRSDQENEIIAAQDKFFRLIEMARQHGIDTALLEEEQQAVLDEIDKRYADERLKRLEDEKAARVANFQTALSEGGNLLNNLTALNEAATEAQVAAAEGNEAKQEQIRKKSFERNKSLQITMATISGIQGVINALTAQSVIPEPFGTILKAANAVAIGVTTAINIAKIRATKYTPSGGGGGGTGTVGSAGSASQSAANVVPNISLFGQSNDLNSLSAPKSVEATPVVKAIVVESDITNTQNRVARINDRAEL